MVLLVMGLKLDLRIPRLRNGTYLPSFLEPRRRSEQALLSVIQEAYVHGVSTRKVEVPVQGSGSREPVPERGQPGLPRTG